LQTHTPASSAESAPASKRCAPRWRPRCQPKWSASQFLPWLWPAPRTTGFCQRARIRNDPLGLRALSSATSNAHLQ
jgi:hypothetical protein